MSDIRRITKGGTVYALVIRQGASVHGVQFLTQETSPFQLGLMEHPKGHTIRAHSHAPQTYDVRSMSEFLYLERGKVRAILYDEEWNTLATEVLTAGDVLLLLAGGHGFEVLEPCRMIEVKQGPFSGGKKAKIYREKYEEQVS